MRRLSIFSALALLVIVASAGVANFLQLQDLRGLVQPSISEPISLEVSDMSKITRMKVVNGETITLVCCQREGEDFEEFLVRCNREWKLLCDSL